MSPTNSLQKTFEKFLYFFVLFSYACSGVAICALKANKTEIAGTGILSKS